MGTDIHLRADGIGPTALDDLQAEVLDLERRWSRFLPESELSRLNASNGVPVVLAADTFGLVEVAVSAWRLTQGCFDPTILPALRAAGYDRTFDALPPPTGEVRTGRQATPGPAPGCAAIELDDEASTVLLPPGVALDLGGVAKGHAADLVVDSLLAAGATGAMASAGGDVRVGGEPEEGGPWLIAIANPFEPADDVTRVAVASGAVVTTTKCRRRWATENGDAHHLIDPRTGQPSDSGLASVTVLAAEAVWAEVLATAAFVAGLDDGADLVTTFGATGLFVAEDGTISALPGMTAHGA